ncbi:MAG: OmpA family protein [Phaeodactylibacter sp.]|nr:OmpA family protein [Phaeodactylibacter sp.]
MNTTTKLIIWLILTFLLVWVWFAPYLWYPCWQEVFCVECIAKDSTEATTVAPVPEDKPGALSFRWDDPTPVQREVYDALKSGVLASMTDDNILEITGLYYEGEAAPEGFDNMGFARAAEVRKLFPDVPDDRIALKARLLTENVEMAKTKFFDGASFNWLEPEKQEKESVETLEGLVIVRFPYNSTARISDPAIDEYLEKLAAHVKTTGEKIRLTGHTDNTGGEDYNYQLGLDRAKAMYSILIEKGVPANQISVDSKGKTQAVASNGTEAGKAENRRVEVRLLKQAEEN